MNLANDIINNKTNFKFEPYKSFCLCLTALRVFIAALQNVQGRLFISREA